MNALRNLSPHGPVKTMSIPRSPEIEGLASRFASEGGRYEFEILENGDVALHAVFDIEGIPNDVAVEITPDPFTALEAVDRVVRRSVEWLDAQGPSEDDAPDFNMEQVD
jgi:hypothetical protein